MLNLTESQVNKRIEYSNKIYNFAYFIIVFKSLYTYTELIPHNYDQIIFGICNISLLMVIAYKMLFLQKYTIRQIVIIASLILITFYTDRKVFMFTLFPDFLLIAALQDVDFKHTISIMYKIEAVILAIHIVIYPVIYFFNKESIKFTYRKGSTELVRHQFLLGQSNIFSMFLLWTILAYLYVNYEKLTKRN